uniref:IclR family transcriptional regulator n=1 Tax=Marinobacterium profundum TaxID=1714300 RepID=UPI0008328A67|nr:IclR family transcriptional regulator [Marinobacterium profundum]
MNNDADPYRVPGLARGLALLHAFDGSPRGMSMAEIARRLKINRSSVFRLVYTLEADGYLQRIDNGSRYRLGARVLDLGFRFLSGLNLLEPARPVMERLRDETGLTAHLSVRDGTDVLYVDRYRPAGSRSSNLKVGARLAAHATSSGQVQLAALADGQVRSLFHNVRMQAFTDQTPTSIDVLLERLRDIRRQPAVLSCGRFDARIASCTAPVYGSRGQVLAALSVSCPLGAVSHSRLEQEIRSHVVTAARALSRSISGFSG